MRKLVKFMLSALCVCSFGFTSQAQKFGHINYEELEQKRMEREDMRDE